VVGALRAQADRVHAAVDAHNASTKIDPLLPNELRLLLDLLRTGAGAPQDDNACAESLRQWRSHTNEKYAEVVTQRAIANLSYSGGEPTQREVEDYLLSGNSGPDEEADELLRSSSSCKCDDDPTLCGYCYDGAANYLSVYEDSVPGWLLGHYDAKVKQAVADAEASPAHFLAPPGPATGECTTALLVAALERADRKGAHARRLRVVEGVAAHAATAVVEAARVEGFAEAWAWAHAAPHEGVGAGGNGAANLAYVARQLGSGAPRGTRVETTVYKAANQGRVASAPVSVLDNRSFKRLSNEQDVVDLANVCLTPVPDELARLQVRFDGMAGMEQLFAPKFANQTNRMKNPSDECRGLRFVPRTCMARAIVLCHEVAKGLV